MQRLAELFGWQLPIQIGQRSNVDFHIARGLYRLFGFEPDDIAAVLLHGSEKAAERGVDYVLRTVVAASA